MEDLSYIPNSLNTAETTPGDLTDYIHLVGLLYDSLRVEAVNDTMTTSQFLTWPLLKSTLQIFQASVKMEF